MKRSKMAATLTLCTLLGMMSPAFAADSKAAAKTPAKTSTSSGGDSPLEKVVDGSLIVTRVGGVGAGLVFGSPVAVVRSTYKTYTTITPELADKVGGKDFAPSVALVSLVSLPASVVWGTVTGAYYGSKNAFTHGFNEPFHPDSFSLGKDFEE